MVLKEPPQITFFIGNVRNYLAIQYGSICILTVTSGLYPPIALQFKTNEAYEIFDFAEL